MYEIVYEKRVFKDLDSIPIDSLDQVCNAIQDLKTNPFPPGHKKLKGHSSLYRIRKGNYRVIYQVVAVAKKIRIIVVGHRKEIYRHL